MRLRPNARLGGRSTRIHGMLILPVSSNTEALLITESEVKERLEDAGCTEMMLPSVSGPNSSGTYWPDYVNEYKDDIKHENTRLRPTLEQMNNWDEVMLWVPRLKNINHRNAVRFRILINPHTGKHIYSWRQIGDKLNTSHETARQWYNHGVMHITRKLNMSHTANQKDPRRKQMLQDRRELQLARGRDTTIRITGKYIPGNGPNHRLGK